MFLIVPFSTMIAHLMDIMMGSAGLPPSAGHTSDGLRPALRTKTSVAETLFEPDDRRARFLSEDAYREDRLASLLTKMCGQTPIDFQAGHRP